MSFMQSRVIIHYKALVSYTAHISIQVQAVLQLAIRIETSDSTMLNTCTVNTEEARVTHVNNYTALLWSCHAPGYLARANKKSEESQSRAPEGDTGAKR